MSLLLLLLLFRGISIELNSGYSSAQILCKHYHLNGVLFWDFDKTYLNGNWFLESGFW